MPSIARLNDPIQGITATEHSGHDVPHGPVPISGNITGGCSGNVFVNGIPAAIIGATTIERDACCVGTGGSITVGNDANVFINGVLACVVGKTFPAHNGTAEVSSGSPDVIIGG